MPGNAAIYLADPSMIHSKMLNSLKAVKSFKDLSDGDSAVGLNVDLKKARVRMSFMPQEQIPAHLKGFEGFMHQACGNQDRLIRAVNRLRNVRFVIGCVIEPELDKNVRDFLFAFVDRNNGLLFMDNHVWDYDGEKLTGK